LKQGDDFLRAYYASNEDDQYLLCELYLHDFLLSGDTKFHPGVYIGDIQLHAFISLLRNQVHWHLDMMTHQNVTSFLLDSNQSIHLKPSSDLENKSLDSMINMWKLLRHVSKNGKLPLIGISIMLRITVTEDGTSLWKTNRNRKPFPPITSGGVKEEQRHYASTSWNNLNTEWARDSDHQ